MERSHPGTGPTSPTLGVPQQAVNFKRWNWAGVSGSLLISSSSLTSWNSRITEAKM